MIHTITLSPALDKTIFIKDIKLGELNITNETYEDAGGKGINVAKILSYLGADVTSIAVLGGDVGKKIERLVNAENVFQENIYAQNNTRTNIKIVDNIKNQCTEINENVSPLKKTTIDAFNNKMLSVLAGLYKTTYLCLCGRLPLGLEDDFYAKYIYLANQNDIKVVLDTSNVALRKGVQAKPWMIKPNIDELREYFGTEIETIEEITKSAKALNNIGIEIVIVTLGENGLICTTKNKAYRVNTPKIEVKSTVGAGDSFVGGFLYEYEKTQNLSKALVFGSAVATAKVTNKGTSVPNVSKIDEILQNVRIQEF